MEETVEVRFKLSDRQVLELSALTEYWLKQIPLLQNSGIQELQDALKRVKKD